MAEVGDDPEAFADGFDALVDAWVEEAGLVLKTDVVRELPVAIVVDAEGEQGELRYAFVDGTLVATISSRGVDPADDLGQLIDGLRGESEQLPLAESPAYAESLAAGADQPLAGVRAWVSLRPLWDLARLARQSADPEGATDSEWEMVENLGALAVSTLAGASWYADGRSRSAAALTIEETSGVFSVLAAAVASQRCELLKLVPPGVDTAVAADLDLAAAFDASLELATEIDPELGWDLISGLADAEADLGFHPKDDLIDRTDGQLAFFLSEVPAEESLPGGLVPGGKNFALLVGLNDGEGMRLLIDALIRKHGLNAARSRQEFEGFDVYLIPIMPVTVAYAVLDDLLVVSLAPSLVQDVLRRKAHPELASLAGSEDYLAARAELPEQASMLSYARGGDGLRSALKTLLEVQRSGQLMISPVSPPVVLPPELQATLERLELPGPEVVDRYVDGVELAVITIHEDGSLSVAQTTP